MSNENSNTTNDWSEREIGALWKKDGANQKYLSGKVKLPDGSSMDLVIFTNKYKKADNQPDFRIYKGTASSQQESQSEGQSEGRSEGQTEVVEEGIL